MSTLLVCKPYILVLSAVISSVCFGDAPCSTKYDGKFCEIDGNCGYNESESKSLLIAIDGTGSREWLEDDVDHNQFASQIGINHNLKWIWKSFVANFFEDYLGISKYFHGPDANEFISAGKEIDDIIESAMSSICQFVSDRLQNFDDSQISAEYIKSLSIDNELGIDLIGFSRGGFTAMEISRRMQIIGCSVNGTQIKPIPVRFMGLYDPVQRDIDIDDIVTDQYDNEHVGDNVLSVSIAERSVEVGSRTYFGYGVQGFDSKQSPKPSRRWQQRFDGTHSGVGGYPGDGDCMPKEERTFSFNFHRIIDLAEAAFCSDSYSHQADRLAASKVDIWMRGNAALSGVPIPRSDHAYYGGFVEYH